MSAGDRLARVDEIRHQLLRLHKAMIDAQRLPYERAHGRIETTSQFLGLVLEHPDFEWIRALSALIAQLDEWREEPQTASDEELREILAALRSLIQPEGPNADFSGLYWRMVESAPDVLMEHVKLWRMIGGK